MHGSSGPSEHPIGLPEGWNLQLHWLHGLTILLLLDADANEAEIAFAPLTAPTHNEPHTVTDLRQLTDPQVRTAARDLIRRAQKNALATAATPHDTPATSVRRPLSPIVPLCPDCKVEINQLHLDGCDVARCAVTGLQRLGCEHDTDACNTSWRGLWPGDAECYAYGFLIDLGNGQYLPDINRLYDECTWDFAQHRWVPRTH